MTKNEYQIAGSRILVLTQTQEEYDALLNEVATVSWDSAKTSKMAEVALADARKENVLSGLGRSAHTKHIFAKYDSDAEMLVARVEGKNENPALAFSPELVEAFEEHFQSLPPELQKEIDTAADELDKAVRENKEMDSFILGFLQSQWKDLSIRDRLEYLEDLKASIVQTMWNAVICSGSPFPDSQRDYYKRLFVGAVLVGNLKRESGFPKGNPKPKPRRKR